MNQKSSLTRYKILWVIIICYVVPTVALSFIRTNANEWIVFNTSFVLAAVGSLILFVSMLKWEKGLKKNTPLSLSEYQNENTIKIEPSTHLFQTPDYKEDKIANLEMENQRLQEKIDHLSQDSQSTIEEVKKEAEKGKNQAQRQSDELMERQQQKIQHLLETIADNKSQLEIKQQQMATLETKVNDMTYEIKTLLKLAETYSGSINDSAPHQSSFLSTPYTMDTQELPAPMPERQIQTSEDASIQLRRCLDIAQKITGSHHFSNQFNSRIESAADSFSIDLRRLCDSLRSENNSTVILYSPKDKELLFSNNQIKSLTGWSPEKFVQDFKNILQDEKSFINGLQALSMKSEAHIQLPLRTRAGNEISVQCHLGLIPTGIFRQHAIAILYLPKSS